MPLTDTRIKSARPQQKPYKLTVGQGLILLVTPHGGAPTLFRQDAGQSRVDAR